MSDLGRVDNQSLLRGTQGAHQQMNIPMKTALRIPFERVLGKRQPGTTGMAIEQPNPVTSVVPQIQQLVSLQDVTQPHIRHVGVNLKRFCGTLDG